MVEESSANEKEWSEPEAEPTTGGGEAVVPPPLPPEVEGETSETGVEVIAPPPLPESETEGGTVVITPAASEEGAPEPEIPSPFEAVEEDVTGPETKAVVAGPAEVVAGGTAPAPEPPKAPGPPAEKKDNTLLIVIIVAVVLLLLCCCCVVGGVILAGALEDADLTMGMLLPAVKGLI